MAHYCTHIGFIFVVVACQVQNGGCYTNKWDFARFVRKLLPLTFDFVYDLVKCVGYFSQERIHHL